MPIEIRELVIKTIVQEDSPSETRLPATSGASNEAIIAECVDKVMEILKEKLER